MRIKDHPAHKSIANAHLLDPRQLKITPGLNLRDWNSKELRAALDDLKAGILSEGGVIQPLEVRMIEDEIHIVSGHGRYQAVMELIAEGAEIDSVPVMVEPRGVNDIERKIRMILHNKNHPFSQLELAEGVRQLLNDGLTREDIRKRLGFASYQAVSNFDLLMGAPEELKEKVQNNEVAAATVIEIVREYGPDKALEVYPEIQERAAQRGKDRPSTKDVRPPKPPKPPKPPGGLSASEINAREAKRLAEFEKKTEKADKAGGDLAKMETVLSILLDFEAKGLKPETVADAFGTRKSDDVMTAADWLMGFWEALRTKESNAPPMPVEPGYRGALH